MFGGRHSKYKNIFGDPRKKEECMDRIKLKVKGSDPPLAAVNGKYLAVFINCSTVDIMIRSLDDVGRIEASPKGIKSANSFPTCIEWCPRDDNLIVVGQQNGEINLMRIPENGIEDVLSTNDSEIMWNCENGSVLGALWHPTVGNALLTSCGSKYAAAGSSQDTHLILWNTLDGSKLLDVPLFNCYLTGMSFNFNGSRLVCTDNLQVTRIIDLRSQQPVLQEAMLHKKSRRQNTVYMKDGYIFSTGYSATAKREYALWTDEDLSEPIELVDVDTNSGVLFPIYDADINVLYVWGKGDSTVHFYEFVPEEHTIKYLSSYSSSTPQLGVVAMPKLGVNVAINEVTRLFKFHNNGFCEFIPVKCPRREQGFSEDVYPLTPGREPALTIEQWLQGDDVDPILISLDSEANQTDENSKANPAAVKRTKTPLQKVNEIKDLVEKIKQTNDAEGDHACQYLDLYKSILTILELDSSHHNGNHSNDVNNSNSQPVKSVSEQIQQMNSLQKLQVQREETDKNTLMSAVNDFAQDYKHDTDDNDPNKDVEWD